MNDKQQIKINKLYASLEQLYKDHSHELLFHGWHHITFVLRKTVEFGQTINADLFYVTAAALTHDLNFIAEKNSDPATGKGIRNEYLLSAGFTPDEILRIEEIITEAHTAWRTGIISTEGKALSDGDTAFKALPTTPVLFSSKYIEQNKIDIYKLATKIVSEQSKLMDQGIYFYTEYAREKYLPMAIINLELWKSILQVLQDQDVKDMLEIAFNTGVL
jgi:uncharacterized protein